MDQVTRVEILGVPLDSVTREEAYEQLLTLITSDEQSHVMTPNSEMLVEAQDNQAFKSVLQQTRLNIPDSAGLLWAAWWKGQHLPERVTGVDTVEQLLTSLPHSVKVFLLGGRAGAGARAGEKMREGNPELNIVGTFEGSPRAEDVEDIIEHINDVMPHVLLVAYGAPAQDMWIHEHLHKFPSVKVAMGVGGTFDFLSGRIQRAPKFFQVIGCEWFWRLMKEPSRIGRIWTAVVVFPLRVLFSH